MRVKNRGALIGWARWLHKNKKLEPHFIKKILDLISRRWDREMAAVQDESQDVEFSQAWTTQNTTDFSLPDVKPRLKNAVFKYFRIYVEKYVISSKILAYFRWNILPVITSQAVGILDFKWCYVYISKLTFFFSFGQQLSEIFEVFLRCRNLPK